MSYLFQTDNVFYVPPKGSLRIYDIVFWRVIEIDVQSLSVRLLANRIPEARSFAAQALERAVEDNEDLNEIEEAGKVDAFIESIPLIESAQTSSDKIAAQFPHHAPTFWVRLSQNPLESFFAEDYEVDAAPPTMTTPAFSTIGSIVFNSFTDHTFDLPSEQPFSFHLSASSENWISRRPLAPDEPLPLLREYCGLGGSSAQGTMVTIDLQGKVPDASLAAVPIRRAGDQRFETLYLHLGNPEDPGLIRVFRPGEENAVASILKRRGFEPARRTRRFACWRRGEDAIQIYRNLPGKESERAPILPPFALLTQINGHSDPTARRLEMESLFGKPENLTP